MRVDPGRAAGLALEPHRGGCRARAFPFEEADIATLSARAWPAATSPAMRSPAPYLDRIALIDVAGPRLNSVIALNPDAIAEADALDAERRAGRVRGPLHGIRSC